MSFQQRNSCRCEPKSQNPKNLYSIPFFTQYSNSGSQCSQQNINNIEVKPGGPIIPTRPIFPSALPPSYSNYPNSVDTSFVTVREQACICDLRVGCLNVNGGEPNPDGTGGTQILFRNIPDVKDAIGVYSPLVVNEQGRVFKSSA